MAIPSGQIAGKSTEANKLAAQAAEDDLFERAGLEPPTDEGPTDGERALANTEYKSLAGMDLMRLNTRWTKQATGQIMGFRRELSGFRTVQQMQSATLREIMETLTDIKRRLSNWEEQGILPGDLTANQDLNPLLGNFKLFQTRRFPIHAPHFPFSLSVLPPFHLARAGDQVLRRLEPHRRPHEVRVPQLGLHAQGFRTRHDSTDLQPGVPPPVRIPRRSNLRELGLHSHSVNLRKPAGFILL